MNTFLSLFSNHAKVEFILILVGSLLLQTLELITLRMMITRTLNVVFVLLQ